jgi:maltose alpha-D-glucosyltransferase/alpha-amylase
LDVEFPDACLISEWGVPSQAIQAGFHMDFCIPFGMPGYTALLRKAFGPGPGTDPYGFSFFDSRGHGNIMEFLDEYLGHHQKILDMGLIALPTGNHDINPRISKGRSTTDLELVFLFILTMPGVPFIWYGDEIGMRSLDYLPSKEGGYNRTGARTPMQWSEDTNAGFSTAATEKLYLPIDQAKDRPTVLQQENDPDSLLQRVRRLVAIRKAHPALQASAPFKILFAQPGVYPLVFLREADQESFIIAVNPFSHSVEAEFPSLSNSVPQTIYGVAAGFIANNNLWKIHLPGTSGGIYRVAKS